MKIIILAGGEGTRLFPLSRSNYPKQFLRIASNTSLLAKTVDRFKGYIKASKPYINTLEVEKFVEKPTLEKAEEYLREGFLRVCRDPCFCVLGKRRRF